jgi:ABC-type transport system involved in multi-copper enzyme maturation permease subunit
MTRLVRTELLKLCTARLTYGLLAVACALTVLFATLEASRAGTAGTGVPPISTASGLSTVTTVTGFAMLFAAVLGAIVSSGEFRHGSITLTYQATPRRERVLIAKIIVSIGAGAIFGLVAAVIATGVGLAFAAGEHAHVALSTPTMLRHIGGAICGAALLAALGVALGSLVRSQLATVIGIFVWGIVIESLIGGLFTQVRPYLPYTAATTLAGAKLGNAAFGPAHGENTTAGPLPFIAGIALLAAIATALSVLAARTTLERDIA